MLCLGLLLSSKMNADLFSRGLYLAHAGSNLLWMRFHYINTSIVLKYISEFVVSKDVKPIMILNTRCIKGWLFWIQLGEHFLDWSHKFWDSVVFPTKKLKINIQKCKYTRTLHFINVTLYKALSVVLAVDKHLYGRSFNVKMSIKMYFKKAFHFGTDLIMFL